MEEAVEKWGYVFLSWKSPTAALGELLEVSSRATGTGIIIACQAENGCSSFSASGPYNFTDPPISQLSAAILPYLFFEPRGLRWLVTFIQFSVQSSSDTCRLEFKADHQHPIQTATA